MTHRLEIPIPCALWALAETAQAAAEVSAAHRLSKRIAFALALAIDDIASNIYLHGFSEFADGAQIILTLDVDADRMSSTFVDNAPAFDPLVEAPAPDTTSGVEIRAVGGLGVHLVKSLTDTACYERKDNQNRLTFTSDRATETDS